MSEIPIMKLSDLAMKIEHALSATFKSKTFWVVGEISGHKNYPDKDRHYFMLIEKGSVSKDPIAKFDARAWTEGSKKIREFEKLTGQCFHDGLEVLVNVRVDYHASYGLSLTLLAINESFTLGNLEKQRRETLRRLVEENEFISVMDGVYTTRNKEAKLNCVIQRIAVIGSSNSEGYVDFFHTLRNNQYGYRFIIETFHSSVQGVLAEAELIETLIAIFNSKNAYDCVAIIRGGGAKSDFLVFDQYKLARAVAKFPIPIVTGIGHQNDVSIVDLMAHTNTKTPTKSAEFIIAHCRSFEERLWNNHKHIINRVLNVISVNKERYYAASNNVINASTRRISNVKEGLVNCRQSIITQTQRIPQTEQQKINSFFVRVMNNANECIHDQHRLLGGLTGKYSHISYRVLVNGKDGLRHIASRLVESTKNEITGAHRKLDECKSGISNNSHLAILQYHTDLRSSAFTYATYIKQAIAARSSALRHLQLSLKNNVENHLLKNSYELKNRSIILDSMDPVNILKRGFALISRNGGIITQSKNIGVGDTVKVEMFDGKMNATIHSKEE